MSTKTLKFFLIAFVAIAIVLFFVPVVESIPDRALFAVNKNKKYIYPVGVNYGLFAPLPDQDRDDSFDRLEKNETWDFVRYRELRMESNPYNSYPYPKGWENFKADGKESRAYTIIINGGDIESRWDTEGRWKY